MKINTLRLMAAAGMMSAVMVPSAAFADYGTTPSTVCASPDAATRALVTCETTTTAVGGLGRTPVPFTPIRCTAQPDALTRVRSLARGPSPAC